MSTISGLPSPFGQQNTLASIANDTTGRFTDTQRREARHLQDLQTTRAMVQSVEQAMYKPKGSGSWPQSFGGDTVSLSQAARTFLSQINAQSGGSQSAAPSAQPVTTTFSNAMQVGGFSISAHGDASTGAYGLTVDGPDGFNYFNKGWFTGTGGGGGGSTLPPGMTESGTMNGSVETVTISRNVAEASSVTASSNAGSTSASAASAESDTITITIDYSTGKLTAVESSASANAASQSQSTPSGPLSITA